MQVFLARAARQRIVTASHAAHPNEACGLLFGERSGRLVRVMQASVAGNVAPEPWHRFEVDPAHLFAAHRAAREGGPPILGVWHSHPQGSATPSRHDRDGVGDPQWLWLIAAPGPHLAAHWPDPASPTGFREAALLDEAAGRG